MRPGESLLHYRLVDKIGEGGMGVVWKAVDSNLGREVAIKVLPELFAQDPERLARFEREARLLASLNHPNIATVHGLHEAEADGRTVRFLAMEMVEGEDLATRLQRGPMPTDEVLALSQQVAAAIEAAHSQGVIHRDLKPANIVVTADGKAKVLDFGLAKAMDPDPASSSGSLSMSPTVTSAGSVAGMILGTAAYMSPEQARGKPLDRRTDLWSFGCVMYECLAGVQLFRGETVSDSMAAILRKDPDWSVLPDEVPPMVRLLVRRCLTRDPNKRLQDAGDARLELEQAIEDPRGEFLGLTAAAEPGRAKPAWTVWLPWAIAGLAILAAAWLQLRDTGVAENARRSQRLLIPVPGLTEFGDLTASPPAISPDGSNVVFGLVEGGSESRLWLRPIDEFKSRPLDGTEGAAYAFWSPDSREVAFFRGGRLRRIEVATGRVQAIGGEGSSYPRGGSWNAKGQILFAPNSNAGIHVIDDSGGEVRQITFPDPEITDSSHRWPQFLPDGDHFLFLLWSNDLEAQRVHGGVYVGSLSSGAEPERIVSDASRAIYASPGFLLVVRGDNLIAIPFDADERRVTGEASVVATGVLRNRSNGHSAFSASDEGTLVYAVGQAFVPSKLTWFDRDGTAVDSGVEAAPHERLRLSPDANRAVATIPGPGGDHELWTIDLVRGVRTRLAYGSTSFENPIWAGSGDRLMFASQKTGSLDIAIRAADGSGEQEWVLVDNLDKVLYDWSHDERYVTYWPMGSGSGTPDLWIYSIERQVSEEFISGESSYLDARFSPDSRWITYVSDESGRMEVFVQALEDKGGVRGGARFQVSTAGGQHPRWRDDGREIVYLDPEQGVMAVAVDVSEGRLTLGAPRELFHIEATVVTGDASGDHKRFLFATRDEVASEPLYVILNWDAAL